MQKKKKRGAKEKGGCEQGKRGKGSENEIVEIPGNVSFTRFSLIKSLRSAVEIIKSSLKQQQRKQHVSLRL